VGVIVTMGVSKGCDRMVARDRDAVTILRDCAYTATSFDFGEGLTAL